MGCYDIFAKFLGLFPNYQEKVKSFKSHGNNGVAIEMIDHQWMTFTYHNDREWELIATNARVRRI